MPFKLSYNSSLKKILMVGPDPEGLGGISRVVKLWFNGNFFDGYKSYYISSTNDRSNFKTLSNIRGLIKFILYLLLWPDIIYIHSSAYNSFYRKSFYIFFANIFRRKIIFHIHPTKFYQFYSGLSGLAKSYSFFILARVHAFVVLTAEMRDWLSPLFPEKPVCVLRNPVDVQSMANKHNIKRQQANLLYLGLYIREKGIYELVDAIDELKGKISSLHLNFFGTKEITQLQNYISRKGLDNEITVNGWILEEEKIHQLYASTLLVLPSHSEGIPNVILEAMATKTPIVSTYVGGIKEILRNMDNALIANVNDHVDLSNKILTILHDRPLRERLSENAYREAKEKYDVTIVKQQFRQIIENML